MDDGVMTEAIRGFWVASATPLATDGSVDSAKLAAHAKQLFGKGVDGVVLFGTTGEGTSFNVTERVATIEAVLKAGVAPDRIGIGGGFPAISDSVALTRAVLGLGLRHVLYLPPYFDRSVTAEGIEDAFAAGSRSSRCNCARARRCRQAQLPRRACRARRQAVGRAARWGSPCSCKASSRSAAP